MKYFVIFSVLVFLFVITVNPVYAMCVYDPSQPHKPCDDASGTLIIETHQPQIENIDGILYYVSESFEINSTSSERIVFHDVVFSPPYIFDPPRHIYSDVMFSDGTKETLSILLDEPDFTEHVKPQAGLVGRTDGFHFLVSVSMKELSLLKQSKLGISFNEMECKNDEHVLTERPNEKVACVYRSTAEKLGWDIVIILDTSPMMSVFKVVKDDTVFDVEYATKGGIIENMTYGSDTRSLLVTIDSTNEGSLTLSIPRTLLDAKFDYCPPRKDNPPDDHFFVLLDGEEVPYDEILTTSEKRTLQISFPANTIKMEIIGTCLI